MIEKTIQSQCMIAASCDPDVLIFRQQSGSFRAMDSDRVVKIGVPGMADSLLIVSTTITPEMVGQRVAIAAFAEFKTVTGRQSDAQRNFQRVVQNYGSVYRVIRTADDMRDMIEAVKRVR